MQAIPRRLFVQHTWVALCPVNDAWRETRVEEKLSEKRDKLGSGRGEGEG